MPASLSLNETYIGELRDDHGRLIEVYRQHGAPAVRLDFGLTDRMLTREQWDRLADLATLAVLPCCEHCEHDPGELLHDGPCAECEPGKASNPPRHTLAPGDRACTGPGWKDSASGFVCTAQDGHDGPDHVAYGSRGVEYRRWPVTATPGA